MATTINASNTTGGAVVTGDGSGILELQSGGVTGLTVNGANVTVAGTLTATGGIAALTSPVSVIGTNTAGAEIRLPEDTDNGSNYVAIKAPNALASNLTFTLPTADGTSGQFLQTNGSGQLAFASVAPGGTTGQLQYNNAGAFAGLSSGTSGQALISQGAGVAPTWGSATPIYNQVGDMLVSDAANVYCATPSQSIIERGWKINPNRFYYSSAGYPAPIYNAFWSNYYNCWFGIGITTLAGTTSSENVIMASSNGYEWFTYATIPANSGNKTVKVFTFAIDDSNGRFFFWWQDQSAFTAGYLYQNTVGDWSGWTFSLALFNGSSYSVQSEIFDMKYVNFGTTATSGIVLIGKSYTSYAVVVIAAGATTHTSKATRSQTSNGNAKVNWDAVNKKCIVSCYTPNATTAGVAYVANDVNGTWTTPTTTAFTIDSNVGTLFGDYGANYCAIGTSSSSYRYSNDYVTWTSASSPGGNIQGFAHNGTYWICKTTTGIWYTASAAPTGWTRIGVGNWMNQNYTAGMYQPLVSRKI